MAEIQHPGVYVEELPSSPDSIIGVHTGVVAFVGWTRRGRTGRARRITSLAEYQRWYGALHPDSYVGFAVKHFFENGGQVAYVLRLTAPGRRVRDPNHPAMIDALHGRDGRERGMIVLMGVDAYDVLCVPGLTDAAVLASLQNSCAASWKFLIADCAPDASVEDLHTGPDPRLTGKASMNAALYFPWIEAPDPTQAGRPRAFPPSGFVAGLYARTDATRGIWKAPAGTDAELLGALRPVVEVTDRDQDTLNPRAINCIRRFNVAPRTLVWGARTLQGGDEQASQWKYIPVRRTALFIETSLYRGLGWAIFEPNDEPLWTRVRSAIDDFLYKLFRQGAFPGSRQEDACYVRCGRTTMTQADIDAGRLIVHVGIALLKPAEFVLLHLCLRAAAASG